MPESAVQPSPALSAALAFVKAINSRHTENIAALMTEDHTFVDALASEIRGRGRVSEAWKAYFQMIPDYSIRIHETFVDGSKVVLLGTARGTWSPDGLLLAGRAWSIPAAWRVDSKNGLIAEWRVYADNEPLRRMMALSG